MQGLKAIDYKGNFTLEDGNTLRRNDSWPAKRRFARDGDKLTKAPLGILYKTISLSYDICKWILEEYDYKAE